MESSSTTTTFSQVVFNDIPHTYPPCNPVTCRYTLTAPFQPNTRDWVGIFKVGWSTTKDYRTFVWVEPEATSNAVGQEEPVRKQVVFQEYYLPKDDSEFYQFCYIDRSSQVRGASTPFCFKNPGEPSVDCSLENDLLVITTQEQVQQSAQEKDALMNELGHMREQNATMKSSLMEREQEVELLKKQSEEREKEKGDLMKELSQMMEQRKSLRNTSKDQQQEIDDLKSLTHIQDKYNRAAVEINQLKQQQREELEGKVKVQNMEISELSVRETEQELYELHDTIQLLQVDLQSSEKEKERMSAELHRVESLTQDLDKSKTENQELRRSLSQQETLQNTLQNTSDDVKKQHQTLLGRLQEAQTQLADEKRVSDDIRRHAEQAERELREAMEQLQKMATSSEQTDQKSGKLLLKLTEAYAVIEEKGGTIEEMRQMITIEQQEKEELSRANQNLRRDIERLHEEFADFQAAPPVPMRPSRTCGSPADRHSTTQEQQQDTPPGTPEYENLNEYTTIESVPDPEIFMCRHCQEAFPGITQDELIQHEQCHKVCPFCTLICDAVEQAVFEDHVYSHEI